MRDETKHTLGPWRVLDDYEGPFAIHGKSNRRRESVVVQFSDYYPRPTEPDARLIAAAPELLGAAEAVVEAYDRGDPQFEIDVGLRGAVDKAKGGE